MGVVHYGERLYGKVDRVSGLFYVSTLFWHLNYIPLVPLRSYLVKDDTDDGESFQGHRVSLSVKNMLVGYLRGWLGAAAIATALVSGMAGTVFFLGNTDPLAGPMAIAVAGASSWCVWHVMTTSRPLFLVMHVALAAISLAYFVGCECAIAQNAALRHKLEIALTYYTIPIANGVAMLFSLTRLVTPASYDRALVLADELGIAREVILARFVATGNDDFHHGYSVPCNK